MHKVMFAAGLVLTPAFAEQAAIEVDGRFEDWADLSPAIIDPTGDVSGSGIDIGRVWIADDPSYLYIRFEASSEFDLADRDTLTLLVDTDNDASSGLVDDGFGAEVLYDFGDLEGRFFSFTTSNRNAGVQIWHSDLGLQGLPTVTSHEFEIALAKDASIQGTNVFDGDRVRIRFVDQGGERVPDDPGALEYELGVGAPPPAPEGTLLRHRPTDVRHMSWNVLNDSPWQSGCGSRFGRILQALDADIMSFQEIYSHSGSQVVAFVEDWVAPGPSGNWHVASNNDCHTVSRYEVLASDPIDGNLAVLLDTTEVLERTTLVINAHLPCCDNDDSRQEEVDRILRFVRRVRSGQLFDYPSNCGLIITGDLNLVGFAQQLDSLVEGDIVDEASYGPDVEMDVDGSDLLDVICMQVEARLAYTWRNDYGWYWPGRLDFTILSDSVFELGNRIVVETDAMSPEKLAEYGLLWDDSDCSDHRALMTDLRPPGCLGDLNWDDQLDGADLSILLGSWGTCSEPSGCSADLNGDGVVGGVDLSIVLGFWGPCS